MQANDDSGDNQAAISGATGADRNDSLQDIATSATNSTGQQPQQPMILQQPPMAAQQQQQQQSQGPSVHHQQQTHVGQAASSIGVVGHQAHSQSQHGSHFSQGNYHPPRQNLPYNNSHHQHHNQAHSSRYSNQRGENESNVNHVLLLTVINPHYPINCDLVNQICSEYGKVQRIVIFKKNGVQAMVEFDSIESAKRAKASLNGCEIYSGCCTLRIEYAKPSKLNVHKNDNESYDYTNPNLPASLPEGHYGQMHANDQHNMSQTNVQGSGNSGGNIASSTATGGGTSNSRQPGHHRQTSSAHHGNHHLNNHPRGGPRSGSGSGGTNTNRDHHHSSHHFHATHSSNPLSSTPQHHVQHVPNPQTGGPPQHGAPYGMVGNTIDNSGSSETFAQDSRYDAPRQGGPPYVGVDGQYMSGGHHNLANNMYSRQDSSHQNQHHNHNRSSISSGGLNNSSSFSSANTTTNALLSGNMSGSPGTVMMVYGLQLDRVNCDKLFNLFCLYGNVVRVKFLRTKEGCAMVQMGDNLAISKCVNSLNKTTLFGNELQISYSKQAFLHDVVQPFILPDGSPSFKDFMSNKNNRFKNPEVASKNRISPPSPVLHFFNAPYGITEPELVHLFKHHAGYEPLSINIFPPKEDSKSFSGLATFKDAVEATEALVICNHITMPKQGAPNPYVLRLCFSQPGHSRAQASYAAPSNHQ